MSLRTVHIIFVTFSTLLCLFLVLWAFLWSGGEHGTVPGIFGILGTLGLPVYGVWFYHKVRKLGM